MKITDAEKKALKGRGYIMTRDGEHFVARIITEDGVLTSDEMITAAQAAEKFGNGNVAMTTRMTIEVQGLTYDRERDAILSGVGLKVLRFSNAQIDREFSSVCTVIDQTVQEQLGR